jgi:solute carrier family 25 2-oxodicarboxylate transporter 21
MQAKEYVGRFANSTECLVATLRGEGVLALYKGVGPQMWRNGIWNGLYFGTIGAMPPLATGASKEEKLMYKFTTGVVGSATGTLANTPFDVVKSRMQQQQPDAAGNVKYRGTLRSLRLVAEEEGVGALYKGLGPRLIRLGPGGGIMLVVFDGLMDLLKPY